MHTKCKHNIINTILDFLLYTSVASKLMIIRFVTSFSRAICISLLGKRVEQIGAKIHEGIDPKPWIVTKGRSYISHSEVSEKCIVVEIFSNWNNAYMVKESTKIKTFHRVWIPGCSGLIDRS